MENTEVILALGALIGAIAEVLMKYLKKWISDDEGVSRISGAFAELLNAVLNVAGPTVVLWLSDIGTLLGIGVDSVDRLIASVIMVAVSWITARVMYFAERGSAKYTAQ